MTIYQRAIDAFGVWPQLRQCQEECAELTAAINRWSRDRHGSELVAEEVADVEIMLAQVRKLVGESAVDDAKVRKLARLEQRISKREGGL